MNPEQRKNHRGGARVQKPESPRREKETKREKKPGRPRTKKQKILLGLYIALTVVAAIIVAGAIVFGLMSAPPEVALPTPTPRHTTIINEQGEEVEVEIPGLSAGRKEQFYTFLVAGVSGGNTDTMLLAAYDVPNQKLSVMSLPRDTYVIYNGRTVMINSVYSRGGGEEGGVEALKKAVGSLTGVTPDFYVLVEWEAVGELVDAIGGVYFDVPRRMYYNDLSQHFKIDLQPGYQLLDGNGAMGVLRWRHNSDDSGHILNSGYAMGDLGRIKTQQAFLTAMVDQLLQIKNVTKINQFIQVFQNNVETDLSFQNILWFAQQAILGGLSMENVEFVTMPNRTASCWSRTYHNYQSYVVPSADELLELVNTKLSPYTEVFTLSDLDIMSVNSDGSISSSTGHVEDSRAARPPVKPTTPSKPEEETPTVDENGNPIDPDTGLPVTPDGGTTDPGTGGTTDPGSGTTDPGTGTTPDGGTDPGTGGGTTGPDTGEGTTGTGTDGTTDPGTGTSGTPDGGTPDAGGGTTDSGTGDSQASGTGDGGGDAAAEEAPDDGFIIVS